MRRGPAAWVLVAAWATLAAPAAVRAGEIHLADPYPQRGRTTILTVVEDGAPVPGAALEVLYRPNSETSHATTLTAGADGRVEWVPEDAGLATLTARAAPGAELLAGVNVAVRFGGFPAAGAVIMILAACLLFGGVIVGFVSLLRQGPTPPEEAVEPPST